MTEFKGMELFMGAGELSLAHIGHLYLELGKAITILGGIQQPPNPCESEEVCQMLRQEFEEGSEEVESIAHDIFHALTGKKEMKK